jgi:farnesyl diphosphate synthase
MIPMSSAPEQLLADAKATEAALAKLFKDLKKGPAPHLTEAMAYAALGGGKRLRAGLVLGAARLAAALSDNDGDAGSGGGMINVAMAFECLHAYSLIHDDLPAMDNAEMRRGKASCHLAFDEATAILAGDTLQTLAFELLSRPDTHADGNVRSGLVTDLARASGLDGMAGGQKLDLEARTGSFSLEETIAMQRLKTGALIRAAAVAGGRVGGGGDTLLDALDSYAGRIGLAFQIADDVLDRTGDTEAMGKPTGRDDDQGKASYVTLMGLDDARDEAERLAAEANQILTEAASGVAGATAELDYMLKISCFMIRREN